MLTWEVFNFSIKKEQNKAVSFLVFLILVQGRSSIQWSEAAFIPYICIGTIENE